MANKYLLGFLTLVILSASVYILLPNKVRIDVGETKTTLKVFEDNSWILAGTEYTKLYDGSSLMKANNRVVNYTIDLTTNKSTIFRYAYFKDGIIAIDTYEFDGKSSDKERYPISHKINILNGQNKILVYEVNDLSYSGNTINNINPPQSFGHNTKVEWEEKNYYSQIFKYSGKDVGKLTIKYRVNSSDYSVNVRLFDPDGGVIITDIYPTEDLTTSSSWVNITKNITYEDSLNPTNITWSWDGTNYSLYDSSLVLFMNFDNRSALGENDTHVVDLSMYGNNGTVVGGSNISWTPSGKYNGAFNFSGGVNYIKVLYSNNFNFTNVLTSHTISVWIKNVYADGVITQSIMEMNDGKYPFALRVGTNLKVEYLNYNGSSPNTYLVSDNNINDGIWHNIIAVRDGTNCLEYLYIDGILNDDDSAKACSGNFGTGSLYIGNRDSSTPRFFNGSIDDVMIFNRSLSASEISQLYNSQLTKHDSQNWSFQTNQSLNAVLNSTSSSYNFPYQLCVSNSSNSQNCSTKTITQIIPNKNVIANFTTSIGNIRNDFYGVTDYLRWFSEDGVYSSQIGDYVDYEWNRNTFMNGNFNTHKQRAYLNDIFSNNTQQYDIYVYNDTILGQLREETKWLYDSNKIIFINIIQMPVFLQNRSSPYCNSSEWEGCPSSNWTVYGDMIVYLMNNLTNNGEYDNVYLEVGNEPYLDCFVSWGISDFCWLTSLDTGNITRATEYTIWYNTTYWAIKNNENLSYIKVGGPSGYFNSQKSFTETFISNASTVGYSWDFISDHPYDSATQNNLIQYNHTKGIIELCNSYGESCSWIISSEFNIGTAQMEDNKSLFNYASNSWGQTYISMLNSYPENSTLLIWSWSKTSKDTSITLSYNIVTQPELINESTNNFKPAYNVTSSFAHLCPAGSTVYQSSSDDSNIKVVSCNKGTQYSVIAINTGTTSVNETLNLSGIYPYSTISNYETNEVYNVIDGIVQLGIMDSYDILYLSGEECEINLYYGPPNTNFFRFGICSTQFENSSARPVNQTDTYGIDRICNNGTLATNVQSKLSTSLNPGWTWYASNESDFDPNITLTTSWQTILTNLGADSCSYVWHGANCSYVTRNPGAYEQYQCI